MIVVERYLLLIPEFRRAFFARRREGFVEIGGANVQETGSEIVCTQMNIPNKRGVKMRWMAMRGPPATN